MVVLGGLFVKLNFEESQQTKIKTRTIPWLANRQVQDICKRMCHYRTVRFFLMKTCINLANSTFNLYVLYIKLAQNTKQFRRLVLESFITVINFIIR